MGCKNCGRNKVSTGTVPSKQNIRELIEKIKRERIKIQKDKDNGQ